MRSSMRLHPKALTLNTLAKYASAGYIKRLQALRSDLMIRNVIFLGAGASAAEGLPIQRDLFTSYFAHTPETTLQESWAKDVSFFFEKVFGITPEALGSSRLPTFEEVLGLIDLAIARGDGLPGFPLEAESDSYPNLRNIRRSVVLA